MARLRKNKDWTDDDTARLKALIASGGSPIRAAAMFDRSITGIRAVARKLGMPFPTTRDVRKKFAMLSTTSGQPN